MAIQTDQAPIQTRKVQTQTAQIQMTALEEAPEEGGREEEENRGARDIAVAQWDAQSGTEALTGTV